MQVSKCPYLALEEHFSIKRPIFRKRHFWNSNADREAIPSAKPFVAIQIFEYVSSSAYLLINTPNIVSDPGVYGLNEIIMKMQECLPFKRISSYTAGFYSFLY